MPPLIIKPWAMLAALTLFIRGDFFPRQAGDAVQIEDGPRDGDRELFLNPVRRSTGQLPHGSNHELVQFGRGAAADAPHLID